VRTHTRQLGWQLILILALAVALVAATAAATYWATHHTSAPHHVLADGPTPDGVGDLGGGR